MIASFNTSCFFSTFESVAIDSRYLALLKLSSFACIAAWNRRTLDKRIRFKKVKQTRGNAQNGPVNIKITRKKASQRTTFIFMNQKRAVVTSLMKRARLINGGCVVQNFLVLPLALGRAANFNSLCPSARSSPSKWTLPHDKAKSWQGARGVKWEITRVTKKSL